MLTKWEGPFLYEPAGGDLQKDWFVWLKYQHPVTGEMVRAGRYNIGFNQHKTKELRRQHGRALIKVIEGLLKEGWSPFEHYTTFSRFTNKSIRNCIDLYLFDIGKGLSSNTLKKYSDQLKLFLKWLDSVGKAETKLSEIKKTIVTDFLAEHRAKRGWSGKTYNDYLNNITTFFNHFASNYDDYITNVPTASLKRAPVHRSGNLAYNDWQFKKLKELMLENGDKILYQFCSLIYYAALRNEAEGLFVKAGHFNFKQKTLRVDSGTAKNRKTEFIPIYPDFMDFLIELKVNEMSAEFFLFGKKDYREMQVGSPERVGQDYFARRFRHYKKLLNLSGRHGIYCYKHTRAVHLGEDGEDLFKIMKLFRHKDLATTMIYMQDLGINTQNVEYKKGRKF